MKLTRSLLLLLALLACAALSRAQEDPDDIPEDFGDEEFEGDEGMDYPHDDDDYGGHEGEDDSPPSTELTSMEELTTFMDNEDASVVGFFKDPESDNAKAYADIAQKNKWDYRFAHTSNEELLTKYKYTDAVAVFKSPKFLSEKYGDKPKARFPGAKLNENVLIKFLQKKTLPLVGVMTHNTKERYTKLDKPLVVLFMSIDFEKNKKGTNYYINRMRKVAVEYKDKYSFCVASKDDMSYELENYGLKLGDKASDVGMGLLVPKDDTKFKMEAAFSVDAMKGFISDFEAGSLEPQQAPEPSYEEEEEEEGEADETDVTVLTTDNFDELVEKSGDDVMLEFYAPWCGHCKQLAPIWGKLATKFKDVDSVTIAKMDATEHSPPAAFEVQGYPTLYFKPGGQKPIPYDGERDLDSIAAFIKSKASTPIKDEL